MTTVPLNELHPGHEIGIDSRIAGRDQGIESLAARIGAVGLLSALGVWNHPDTAVPYVVYGNRRLAALQLLASRGEIEANSPVPVEVQEGDLALMLELSLIENVERVQLHPVDEFEAYAGMVRLGANVTEIAEHFGVDRKVVSQRLALGRLHPELLALWRDGRILETDAQQLTVIADKDAQLKVYTDVCAANGGYAPTRQIKRAIRGDGDRAARELILVGEDAYVAAGGRIIEDLFSDDPVILDPNILGQLADQLLADKAAALKAEGWGFAYTERDRPDNWYTFKPIGAPDLTKEEQARIAVLKSPDRGGMDFNEAWAEERQMTEAARIRSITPEMRADAGCLITVKHDGRVEVTMGYAPANGAAPKAKDDEPNTEPQSVIDKTREGLTLALADAVSRSYDHAFHLFLATMLVGQHKGSPLQIVNGGAQLMPHRTDLIVDGNVKLETFEDAILYVGSLDNVQAEALFSQLIATSIDVRTPARKAYSDFDQQKHAAAIAATGRLLGQHPDSYDEGDTLQLAIAERFDALAYFSRSPASFATAAIVEMQGAEAAAVFKGAKKADLAAAAAKSATQLKWLPLELRLPGYVAQEVFSEAAVTAPVKAAKKSKAKAAA